MAMRRRRPTPYGIARRRYLLSLTVPKTFGVRNECRRRSRTPAERRTVMRLHMRLVESSDPYVYHVTPAEPLSARGLIQRDGVREVEFRSLPPLCEQAI